MNGTEGSTLSPIQGQMQSNMEELTMLKNQLLDLEKRLTTVMRPAVPAPKTESDAEKRSVSAIKDMLDDQRMVITQAHSILQGIFDRLEI